VSNSKILSAIVGPGIDKSTRGNASQFFVAGELCRRGLPPLAEREHELGIFFAAYRQLRIKHQLSYANYKLQSDHKLFSAMVTRQATILENISMIGISLLI
jgi:hypothetical protein